MGASDFNWFSQSGQYSVASGQQYCQAGTEATPKSVGTHCALAAKRTFLEDGDREGE